MSVVGTAYVVVQAITKNLDKQIERQVEAGVDKAAPGLEKSGRKAGDAVGDGIADGVRKNRGIDDAFDKVGDRASERLLTGMRRRLRERTTKWSESLARLALPNLRERFHHLGDRAALWFWSRVGGGNRGNRAGRALANAIKDIPLPPILPLLGLAIPLIGGALKVIGSYLAATISLAAQLGPAMAGAAAVGVQAYLTLGQAVGAVMLAFKVQTPLLTRFKEVASSVGKQWQSVGAAVQKGLLPALGGALTRITSSLLPTLRAELGRTGVVLGAIAQKFAKLTENPLFQARLRNIMSGNNELLRYFGDAFVRLADAAVILLSAARPLTDQFGKWVAKLAAGWQLATQNAEQTGRLAGFFERAGSTLRQLGRIFKSTFGGIADIFKAAAPQGQTLLDPFEAIAARFSAWTSSLSGKSKLSAFFAAALPIVHEFNGLIGDIFKILGQGISGNGEGTVAFIKELRTQILPALVDIGKAFSNAGPGFAALIASIGDFVQALAATGTLGNFTAALQLVFSILAKILSTPIVGTVAGWALGFLAFSKAISWIPGFGLILSTIGGLLWSLAKTVIPALGKAILLLGRAFLGFLISNPWVAVVALIIGALVLAYNKFEWFRNFVNAVWAKIVEGALWVWDKLQVFWAWLATYAWPVIQKIGGWIGTVLVGYFKIWWAVVSTVFGWIRDYAIPIVMAIWNALWKVGEFVGTILVGYFKIWWGIASWVFKAIVGAVEIGIGIMVLWWQFLWGKVKFVWDAIWAAVSWAWNAITGAASAAAAKIAEVWNNIWAWAEETWNKISAYIGSIWTIITSSIGRKLAPIIAAWQIVYNKVKGIWDGFVESMSLVWSFVASGVQNAFSGLKSWINEWVIDKLNSAIDLINKIPHPGEGIPRIPRLAHGGTVMPTPGGTIAVVAEAGRPERVEPLDSRGLSNRDYAMIEALTGGAGPTVRVFIGDQELRGIIRYEVDRDQSSRSRGAFYSRSEVGGL